MLSLMMPRLNTPTRRVLASLALLFLLVARPADALQEFETRNYIIYTDIPADDIRPLARHMDRVFNEYKRRFANSRIGRDSGRGKEALYLFGTRDAYVSHLATLDIRAENSGGMFFSRGNKAGLATWVYDKERKETIQTLQHEGFHQFAHRFIGPDLPLWVNEGLAVYFEQARLVKNKFKIGVAEPYRINALRTGIDNGDQFPIDQLITITSQQWHANMSDPVKSAMQYNQSWSICHFLIHGDDGRYQAAFNKYLSLIAAGRPSDRAFETAFQTDNYQALERVWIEYVEKQLKPDPYSLTIDKLDFLASAALWLKQQDQPLPDDFETFKARLKQAGYSITYQGEHKVDARDDAVFVYTDQRGGEHPFGYEIDDQTGLPILSAKQARPAAKIEWSRVGDELMYDIRYR